MLGHMEVQSALLIAVDLGRRRLGGLGRHPDLLEHGDQFHLLAARELLEGLPFGAHLGVDLLIGRPDRGVLPQRHGERPGQQTRHTGEQHGVRVSAGCDAGDQGGAQNPKTPMYYACVVISILTDLSREKVL